MSDVTFTASPGGWARPSPLLIEVASTLRFGSWVPVDGLMVGVDALPTSVRRQQLLDPSAASVRSGSRSPV